MIVAVSRKRAEATINIFHFRSSSKLSKIKMPEINIELRIVGLYPEGSPCNRRASLRHCPKRKHEFQQEQASPIYSHTEPITLHTASDVGDVVSFLVDPNATSATHTLFPTAIANKHMYRLHEKLVSEFDASNSRQP
ncbi:hypothetical protein YC2023_117927 [Brassica napus]